MTTKDLVLEDTHNDDQFGNNKVISVDLLIVVILLSRLGFLWFYLFMRVIPDDPQLLKIVVEWTIEFVN